HERGGDSRRSGSTSSARSRVAENVGVDSKIGDSITFMIVQVEGRRERKKRAVRESILAVSRKLLAKGTFEQTRVEQIAESADVAQATFFNYFPTKRHVLRALAEETMLGMYTILEAKRLEPKPTLEKLADYFSGSAVAVARKKLLPRELL